MDRVLSVQPVEYFTQRVQPLVELVYAELGVDVDALCDRIYDLLEPHLAATAVEPVERWSQDDVLLITYGNSISDRGQGKPLHTLYRFLSDYLLGTVTGVHILPFFPYSSDDGFAVIDYRQVSPELGDWEDIRQIAGQFDLMVDLVINHVSSQSEWFQQLTCGQAPGCDYFIAVAPDTDLSEVVRPRNTPLLRPVETPQGQQHVWATFSHDQIDLNFSNPDVLLECIRILIHYLNAGTRILRLDAIGYLWKAIGTPCIHLPKTHALVKLIREILYLLRPGAVLVTETNVPNRENLTYFGNRNEAHLIYNFSLPPLVVNALLQGSSKHLKTWMMSMPPAPFGCAYLNFTASHDGIGMRPTEGLLDESEYNTFLSCMQQFGGEISMRTRPDGSESPYEVNISFFDAMKGTAKGEDRWQIQRFLCSQIIMMSLEGIPAFYIHSLLATSNDREAVQRTGRKRSINRHQWDYSELKAQLQRPNSPHAIVFRELSRAIAIRRRQPAFHPNATQYTLHLKPSLFAFWRQSMSRDQSIFSIHNLTSRTQRLALRELNLIGTEPWFDLLGDQQIEDNYADFVLRPYQSAWISNKSGSESAHSYCQVVCT
ncbi:sugar phosphorylase [Synechococcus sp. PCC 7336]|uniref:sugar phosphorylase n=1 Tax=Synechococcus sp. PCC 7336 TaxID=195250 RepID=UPI00034B187D|nr:sugar phosphorylase [Synechococcus sp. PCC 7336]